MAGNENSGFGEFKFEPSATSGDTNGAAFDFGAIASNPDFGASGNSGGSGDTNGGNSGSSSGNTGSDSGTGKRRGRPPGSKNRASSSGGNSKAARSASVEGVTRLLQLVSVGVASATKIKEFELEAGDSKSLAEVYINLAEQYGYKPDPKLEALFAAVVVTGQIAGAKVISYRMRMIQERREREAGFPQPDNVINATWADGAFRASQ